MSCYNPLHGFVVGTTKKGKMRLQVMSSDVKALDKDGQPVYHEVGDDTDYILPAYELPCGHCLGCRTDHAKEWSNRLIMESQYHDSTFFVTLTYDDEHLPVVESLDDETGEYFCASTLDKRDAQLFIKRLRRAFPDDKIRYYIAGEYGPSTGRAHMHAIIFGLHLVDLQPFGRSETGNQYFISEALSRIWNKGFVSVEPANEYTMRYVCAYVTTKIGAHCNAEYEERGLVPPFALMSLKPGLGCQYLLDNWDKILDDDVIVFGDENGSHVFRPPRYWYKKVEEYFLKSPEDLECYKLHNTKKALDIKEGCLSRTDLSWNELLENRRDLHDRKYRLRDGV